MFYLCVVELKMREFEIMKHLDMRVLDHEIAIVLSPALLKWPVLTTLDTATLHHPETRHFL